MLRRYPVFSFVVLAYAITGLAALPLALSNRGLISTSVPGEWEAFAALGPFLAAWAVLKARTSQTGITELWNSFKRWRIGSNGWILVTGTPLLFLALATATAVFLAGSPPNITIPPLSWSLARHVVDLVLVAAVIQSLGEEPGWRGFLLPQLRQRFGPLGATLLLYPAWLCWHLPMIFARPEFSLAQFGGFAMGILSAAIWLTLIYEKTRSLLAAIIWHALVNLTRNLALELSTTAFLVYGATVSVGALLIVIWWAREHIQRSKRN